MPFAISTPFNGGNNETYSRQNGVMSRNVVAAMLSSSWYQTYDQLKTRNEERFTVSVRCLDTPERLFVHKTPVVSLRDWHLLFQKDVFAASVNRPGYRPPILQPSKRFYSVRFNDARHRPFEVYVAPVLSTDNATKGDIVTMFICPPEMPRDDLSRLEDDSYPSDIFNMLFCDKYFQAENNTAMLRRSAVTNRVDQALVIQQKLHTEIITDLPEYWKFSFESPVSKERNCGDRTIPQMLSRLWFLRDNVNADVRYSVVQLNDLSYIGVLENVAGFNVFFQVNCHMGMHEVLSFMHDVPLHLPRSQRGPFIGHVPRTGGREGSLRLQTSRYNGIRGIAMHYFDGADDRVSRVSPNGPTVKDLWRRVVSHADARLTTSAVALKEVLDSRGRADLAYFTRLMLSYLTPGVTPDDATGGVKAKNRASAASGKYYLLRVLMESVTNDELIQIVDTLGSEGRYLVGEGVDFAEVWKSMPAEITKDSMEVLGDSLVPDVFSSKIEMIVYLAQFPGALQRSDERRMFGGTKEWIDAESDHLAANVTPDEPGINLLLQAVDSGLPLYRSEMISWILSRVPQWVNPTIEERTKFQYTENVRDLMSSQGLID